MKYKTTKEFKESLRNNPKLFKQVREKFAKYEKVKKGELGFNVGAIKMINDPFADAFNEYKNI